jgi:hypothetical protein
VEFLLHALAGCVTTTTVLHAAARGIEIESLSTTLVGDIDLQGLLALGDVAPGYQSIRIEMDIKATNASDTELDDLLQYAQAHSPVCNHGVSTGVGHRRASQAMNGRAKQQPCVGRGPFVSWVFRWPERGG